MWYFVLIEISFIDLRYSLYWYFTFIHIYGESLFIPVLAVQVPQCVCSPKCFGYWQDKLTSAIHTNASLSLSSAKLSLPVHQCFIQSLVSAHVYHIIRDHVRYALIMFRGVIVDLLWLFTYLLENKVSATLDKGVVLHILLKFCLYYGKVS